MHLPRGGTGGYGYYAVQAEKGAEAHSEEETGSETVTMTIGTKEWLKKVLELIHRIENRGK